MADDIQTDEHAEETSFLAEVEAKFGADDDARADAEDGLVQDEGEGDDGEGSGTDAARGAGEHPATGTSATGKAGKQKRDGASAESAEDSPDEGDDAEHPGGSDANPDSAEGAEDDDADDADAGEEDEQDEGEGDDDPEEGADETDDELSDDLKAAAARHAIPLTLDDVTDPVAKKVVAQKIKAIDASYTKAMQEARAYRTEEAQLRADIKFREENPELVIAEILAKDPTLIEKVQARLDKLEDPDAKEAFQIVVENKRKQTLEAMTTELQASELTANRVEEVESYTRRTAAAKGLPWEYAERAVYLALMAKPENQRDVTNAEIDALIAAEAKTFDTATRKLRRESSKETVRTRTANRRPVSPATKATAAATAPRPARAKPVEVDYNDPEARVDALMGFAKQRFPGKK